MDVLFRRLNRIQLYRRPNDWTYNLEHFAGFLCESLAFFSFIYNGLG